MPRPHIRPSRRRVLVLLAAASVVSTLNAAPPDPSVTASAAIRTALAPEGVLRASINLGNPVLARSDGASNARPSGVSVDLAERLAARLGVPLELVVVDGAGKSVDVVATNAADVGFFAIDPRRGESIAFTRPYLRIEGSYLVRDASPLRQNADVDESGHRIVVGKGSAYDLFLTREIRRAEIVRAPTSPRVVDVFLATDADVAAGVRQQLEADARRRPGLRVLDGRFMVIEQAMGVARTRGVDAVTYVDAFVEEMNASGFVTDALARHGVGGATASPP